MSSTAALVEEREFLLQSLLDLDREHERGLISDDEYTVLRDQQIVRAAAVLRSLDAAVPVDLQGPPSSVPVVDAHERWLWAAGIAVLLIVCVIGIGVVARDRTAGESTTGSVVGNSVSLLAKAEEQTARGNAADAVKTYDQVLKIDPNNVQALTYRGWLIRLAGLPDKGLETIDKAIALRPTYADAHFFRGFILLRDKKDPAGAITEFNAFLANNPPEQMVPLVQQALQDAQAQVK